MKEKVAQPPQEEEQAAEDDVISPMSDMPEDLESKVTEESHDKESGITSFRFEGKYYIRDPENSVFALNDEGNPVEAAGSWDPISNTIMFKDGYNP